MKAFVTTSWDDGHPLDGRLAELLARYRMPATFYIPRYCEGRAVMLPDQIRQLAERFEAGAHTLSHRHLTSLADGEAAAEIADSRHYLEDLTGRPCVVFAPPAGRFGPQHLRMASEAGLRGFRTTELLNSGPPRWQHGLAVLPTTLQVYAHPVASYCRNAFKRMRPALLLNLLRHASSGSLTETFTSLLSHTIARGGVLHLWGHSWEIEEHGAWAALQFMLARIDERRESLVLGPNSALCRPGEGPLG